MASTVIFEGKALLTTTTVSEQVMIDARQSMESDDYDNQVSTLSTSEVLTVTGGTKGTLISTNLSGTDTICCSISGVMYNLGSLIILPGGIGELIITNNLSSGDDVRVEIVVVN